MTREMIAIVWFVIAVRTPNGGWLFPVANAPRVHADSELHPPAVGSRALPHAKTTR